MATLIENASLAELQRHVRALGVDLEQAFREKDERNARRSWSV